eukprot:CAMPEP_0119295658 /NCGR_PEP_ID=MMETSP1329-20130426/50158_1 /TAXON_ID=114041 /ORGANISM="Genus nov. species nov., Strain RCC1024" /LENGTH=170 /DNA_ID=CAMNT_0007296577 /DNA_START=194 /DNA_END=703 /DNA_ORIENTATION=+
MLPFVALLACANAFAPRAPFRRRLRASATTTSDMVATAESILDAPATDVIDGVSFTRYGTSDGDPLLYVPGVEFRGVSVAAQLPGLVKGGYDPWYCWVDGEDRTPFDTLAEAVAEFCRRTPGVVLVGESMGGLVATAAALRLSDSRDIQSLRGVALVNPATSYDRTAWSL